MKKFYFGIVIAAIVLFFRYSYIQHKTNIQTSRSEGFAAGDNLFLQRAGNSGDVNAKITAGMQLISGHRTARDVEGGLRLLEEAAAAGSTTAMYDLGQIYLKGVNEAVGIDRAKAAYWLKKASDGGHKNAKQALEQLETGGYDVPS